MQKVGNIAWLLTEFIIFNLERRTSVIIMLAQFSYVKVNHYVTKTRKPIEAVHCTYITIIDEDSDKIRKSENCSIQQI